MGEILIWSSTLEFNQMADVKLFLQIRASKNTLTPLSVPVSRPSLLSANNKTTSIRLQRLSVGSVLVLQREYESCLWLFSLGPQ